MAVPAIPNWKERSKFLNGRLKLLSLLAQKAKRLRSTHRMSSFGRLFGSTMDIIFAVGGFLLDEFKFSCSADGAFMISFASGMICLSVTLMEIMYSYGVDDEILEAIREDERNVERFRNSLVARDTENMEFLRIATQPIHVPEEEEEESVFNFNPQDMWNTRVLLKFLLKVLRESSSNPIVLDVSRMQLQLYCRPKNYLGIFSLSVRDLPEEQKRISSVPVSGRMLLNSLTAFMSVCNLRDEFMPKQYRKLLVLKRNLEEQTFDDRFPTDWELH